MKDEYIIINKTSIQKRIEELENLKDNPDELKDPRDWSYVCGQLDILNSFKSQSTPLIPEIEKAYDAGMLDEEFRLIFDNPRGRYLNSLKLDI